MSDLAELVNTLEEYNEYRDTHKLEFYVPYEFQKAFHHAETGETYESGHYEVKGVILAVQRALMAANQSGKCITKQTLIDHPDGTKTEAGLLYERGLPFPVLSWNGEKLVESIAVTPIKKPPEECFRVLMDDGQWFECAANHRVLTSEGWHFFSHLQEYLLCLPQSNSEFGLLTHASDVLRYFEITEDSVLNYPYLSHLYDEQPRIFQDNDQVSFPLLAYVLQRAFVLCNLGVLVNKYTNIQRQVHGLLSNLYAYFQNVAQIVVWQYDSDNSSFLQCHDYNQEYFQLHSEKDHHSQLVSVTSTHQVWSSQPSLISPISFNKIIAYQSVGVQDIYDFTVPEYGNYYSMGVIHHNTASAAMEVAMHATGQYPLWWKGHRFKRPVNCVVAGNSNESVRDVVQNELIGDPFSEVAVGTGTIPKDCIGKTTRKAGVPNALSAVMVKHTSGKWSKIRFMAYEQGPDPYKGIRFDIGWLDEEPPQDVWTQFIRATISRKHGEYTLFLTFTPENGVTEVVSGFMNDLTTGQALIRAAWTDAPHMTIERQAELLDQLPPHERDMRSKGIPMMGSGLIFPIADDDIMIEPFSIPLHWWHICGIDFGIDHPFAAVWIAWDRDTNTIYVYDAYRVSGALPPMHASAIKKRDTWIPIVWPHDGLNTDKGSGIPLASLYREEGLNLLPEKFSNPPSPNQKEGQGGNGVEVGLFDMLTSMNEGRFKVFSNLFQWFEEKRQYHRKLVNGKSIIVDRREDLMSATRYAYQSLRFASIRPISRKVVNTNRGLRNW